MKSRLYLKTEADDRKTRIADMYFTPPYKIMSPFVNGKHIDIMQMCASAGLLCGDRVCMELIFGKNSDVTYLSQSYEKVFDTNGKDVQKNLHMTIESGAKVKYFPYPIIPFQNSRYISDNQINAAQTATLLYSDIFTCGRVGMGEQFKMESYRSKTRIFIEDKLVFADNTLLCPKLFHHQSMGMWKKYTHNGVLYIYCPEEEKMERVLSEVQGISMSDMEFGVTRCYRGIGIRVLANWGERIIQFFENIANKI